MVEVPDIIIEDDLEPAVPVKLCPHLKKSCRFRRIEPKIRDLKLESSRVCKTCAKEVPKSESVPTSAQLWMCLACGNLFCGRYDNGHAASHHEKIGSSDCLMWNIESHTCWCYLCDDSIRSTTNRNEVLVQVEKYWEKHAENAVTLESTHIATDTKDLNYRVVTPGLQNLGNTCFFNSVIQLLASVEQLHEIISPHPYEERSTLEILSTTGFTISFTKVLNEIYSSEKEKSAIKPTSLFAEVHRKFPRFTKGTQQDAQELLHYLLEGLKADEMSTKNDDRPDLKRSRSRRKTTGEEEFEMTDRGAAATKKYDWKPSNYIESIFEGRLASIVVCSACKSISTTYDQFEELSLSIVQEKPQNRERKSRFRAAMDDIGRKGRSSLSLTRTTSLRRGSSAMLSRSRSKEPETDSDGPTSARSPKLGRNLLSAGNVAIPISMSEAVSEEETEDPGVEKQLKVNAFSMSDAKSRLERLSFAFSKKPISSTCYLAEPVSPGTGDHAKAESGESGIPPPSIERLQYIEKLLHEPNNAELQGSIEDSLRDFTAVECLENENAFACEECAKMLYLPPPSSPEAQGKNPGEEIPNEGNGWNTPCSQAQTNLSSISSDVAMDIDSASATEEACIDDPMDVSDAGDTGGVGVDDTQVVKLSTPSQTVEKPKHILRKAYKRFLVADLPNILILHLKRFQQSGKSIYSSLRKNDAIVNFTEELDMGPYLMPRPDESGSIASCRYRCIGAIVHIGTINSGHYVAYFLTHKVTGAGVSLGGEAGSKARQWVFASDAITRPCSWAEVAKSRAYMVWYERL